MTAGRLVGVGVGPGDPLLLTLRAVAAIEGTRRVAYLAAEGQPSLARAVVQAHLTPLHAEMPFEAPMREDAGALAAFYDGVAATLARCLDDGDDVALLCLGDPLLYGTFVYVLDRLRDRYAVEIVPGITSAAAAAARTARVLARRKDGFAILPAMMDEARLRAALEAADAGAILKVGGRVRRLQALLADLGRLDDALLVAWVGWPEEKIMPFKDWAEAEAPYFSLVLLGERPA